MPMRQPKLSRAFRFALLFVIAGLTACTGAPTADSGGGKRPRFQADPGLKGTDSLDVYADGATIHALLAEGGQAQKTALLRYTRSEDGGETWSAPVAIDTGAAPLAPMKRGNDVQIAASGTRLVAVWQTSGAGFRGRGPLATAISNDGGKTWTAAPNPADDGSRGGHAFVDIAADASGAFHLVWLDDRTRGSSAGSKEPHRLEARSPAAGASGKHRMHGSKGGKSAGEATQGLRYARSTDGGRTWSRNATVDEKTCSCCWNTLAASPNGALYLLYRDAAGTRDMALAQSNDGGRRWRNVSPVGAFGWKFEGCPHVGGGLAAPGDLHSLVWTGEEHQSGMYYLRSGDEGSSWTAPLRIGESSAAHGDAAAMDPARIALVWDASDAQGAGVYAMDSGDNGQTWSQPRRLSAPGLTASHPRIVATPFGFRVFWTEARENGPVAWAMAGL